MKAKKLFFMGCHLAGRQYYDVDEVWEQLHVGTLLRLEWDKDNRYDKDAVAVMYDSVDAEGQTDTYLLGYVPASDNTVIAHLLQMGWSQIFETRICKMDSNTHYENQIHLAIRLRQCG